MDKADVGRCVRSGKLGLATRDGQSFLSEMLPSGKLGVVASDEEALCSEIVHSGKLGVITGDVFEKVHLRRRHGLGSALETGVPGELSDAETNARKGFRRLCTDGSGFDCFA
jgi:hypothetical protein